MVSVERDMVTPKSKYLAIIEEFLGSGNDTVRLEDLDAPARRVYMGLNAAVRRYGITSVRPFMRRGELYLSRSE